MNELDLTLSGLRTAYSNGLTPEEVFALIRRRAESLHEHNIWLYLLSESEIASYIENLQTIPIETAPLWGVPFAIKDNIDLAAIPTTAGCSAFSYMPDESAFVVKRLIEAGAIPVGKTNLDQFATGLNGTRSFAGPCRNAFNPDVISGGSSSGSAVSVAAGLSSFSLGTDTAGSGRIPAALNNLVGVKPSIGLISTSGVIPACKSLDCVSIFALNTDDANTVLGVAEGFDSNDAYSRANGFSNSPRQYAHHKGSLTLGVLAADELEFFGDEAYRQAYQSTLAILEDDGIEFKTIDYKPFDEVAKLLYEGPWVAERYVTLKDTLHSYPDSVFPVVKDIVARGAEFSAHTLFEAIYRLKALSRICELQLSGIDALMTPTAGRPYTIAEMLDKPVQYNSELGYYMNFMNLLDMAALAVPTAFTSEGFPFGVTLGAKRFSDRKLLSIGKRIQQLVSLPVAATSARPAEHELQPYQEYERISLVVCGAHLQGMPLNWQLIERGAVLKEKTVTSPEYKLFAIDGGPPQRPALVHVGHDGCSIEVEVWELPGTELGGFLHAIPAPLGLGKVSLANGQSCTGFIAEPRAIEGATDISSYGGWRGYMEEQGR